MIIVGVGVISGVKKNIQNRDIRQKEASVPFRGHSKTLISLTGSPDSLGEVALFDFAVIDQTSHSGKLHFNF